MPAALPVSPRTAALVGLAGLAAAMGVGRFAFTPLLPLMQQAGALSLAQGGSLARANYLGYLVGALLSMALTPSPARAARAGLVAVAALTAGMGLTGAFGAWLALRFLAGVASAFVLVGVSSWALPLLAAQGRAGWSGWVFAGVGLGIWFCGLVGLATGSLGVAPAKAWLLLAACSAAVPLVAWRALGAGTSSAAGAGAASPPLPAGTWRLVLAYGAFGFGYIVPATFLPAAAREVVPDPAVFGWTWPVFGVAAAISTVAIGRWWRHASPRRLWTRAQVVMAAGLLLPALDTSVTTLLLCALCVGGTFMVVTMTGIQEGRRVAGGSAPRLIAAMTAAFAVGQLVGPYTVTSLGASAATMAVPYVVASAVLLLGALALAHRPAPEPVPVSAREGDRP
jgi:predicted MFS family arabinose efflux permease